MKRDDLLALVGDCEKPPSEAMLDELHFELEGLRHEGIYGATDHQLVDTVRARRLVVLWKLRHQL